jgi:hypothetical protein
LRRDERLERLRGNDQHEYAIVGSSSVSFSNAARSSFSDVSRSYALVAVVGRPMSARSSKARRCGLRL